MKTTHDAFVPLHFSNTKRVVKLLLANRADVTAKDNNGNSATSKKLR